MQHTSEHLIPINEAAYMHSHKPVGIITALLCFCLAFQRGDSFTEASPQIPP